MDLRKLKNSIYFWLIKAVAPPVSLATEYSPNFEAPVRWCPKGECLCSLRGALPERTDASDVVDPLTIVWEVVPYDLSLPENLQRYIATGKL